MSLPLPDLLDPWRAVDSRTVLAGRLPLSSMPRLRGLLLDTAGDVAFRLAFFREGPTRPVLRCEVTATLRLCCQRCLEGFDHQVDTDTLLALVRGLDEVRQLPEQYDPLLVSTKPLRPRDLIEDELLLALPQIPVHEPASCAPEMVETQREPGRGAHPREKTNPFRVLAELRTKNRG